MRKCEMNLLLYFLKMGYRIIGEINSSKSSIDAVCHGARDGPVHGELHNIIICKYVLCRTTYLCFIVKSDVEW